MYITSEQSEHSSPCYLDFTIILQLFVSISYKNYLKTAKFNSIVIARSRLKCELCSFTYFLTRLFVNFNAVFPLLCRLLFCRCFAVDTKIVLWHI